MLIGVGVSCRILYFIVIYCFASCSGPITSVGEERAIFLLSFACNYVLRGSLFLLMFGVGYVILLWHSLGLPHHYCNEIFAHQGSN